MSEKRIIIACGGTGGHFYPGFALGGELKKRGFSPIFLVRKNDPAVETLEAASLPWCGIDAAGLPRGLNPARHAVFWWKLAGSLNSARKIFSDCGPLAVAGMGGYVSFPAAACAKLMGIPVMIHESNAIAGLANRLSAFFADAAALGLPSSGWRSGAKLILTGTPVRPEFSNPVSKEAARKTFGLSPDAPAVLIFGGSQGASGLNEAALAAEAELLPSGIQFIHVAGKRDFPEIKKRAPQASGLRLLDYCDGMVSALSAADLVVSRSGASTIAELCALKKPAILVPFPKAAAHHQDENARALERAGAASVLPEDSALKKNLSAAIKNLLGSPEKLAAMSVAYSTSGLPDPLSAAKKLADAVESIAGRGK